MPHQEDIQMCNNHMIRCSTSQIMWKMKNITIKLQIHTHQNGKKKM